MIAAHFFWNWTHKKLKEPAFLETAVSPVVLQIRKSNCMFRTNDSLSFISWLNLHFFFSPAPNCTRAHFEAASNWPALNRPGSCVCVLVNFIQPLISLHCYLCLCSSQEPAEQKTGWCQSKYIFYMHISQHGSLSVCSAVIEMDKIRSLGFLYEMLEWVWWKFAKNQCLCVCEGGASAV